ncbi:unnamed protein product [Amoebophrya sp. A25]|nr:unnamed protein product [Amoebophrya sp. A25]|eukprot:GSA25T00005163001.1
MRNRERPRQAAEMKTLQILVDRRVPKVTAVTFGTVMRKVVSHYNTTYPQRKLVYNYNRGSRSEINYVHRVRSKYSMVNTKTGAKRSWEKIPQRNPKVCSWRHTRAKRFKSTIEAWTSFYLIREDICAKMGLPPNSDLRGKVVLVNLDEVCIRRRYGQRGGFSANPFHVKDSFGIQDCDTADQSGTVLCVAASDTDYLPPLGTAVLPKDHFCGPSEDKRMRRKKAEAAMEPFGKCNFSDISKTARNGKVNNGMYLEALAALIEHKKEVDKRKKVETHMIIIHDDSNVHNIPDGLAWTWKNVFNVRFCKIGGGGTATIQLVDMAGGPAQKVSQLGRRACEESTCDTYMNKRFWEGLRDASRSWGSQPVFDSLGFRLDGQVEVPEDFVTPLRRFLIKAIEENPIDCGRIMAEARAHRLAGQEASKVELENASRKQRYLIFYMSIAYIYLRSSSEEELDECLILVLPPGCFVLSSSKNIRVVLARLPR